MIAIERRRAHRTRVGIVLAGALLSGACQSLPGAAPAPLDIERAVPGELARERHAHVLAAVSALDGALGGTRPRLEGLPLDAALERELASLAPGGAGTASATLEELADEALILPGPYRLARVDTATGRLEYRAVTGGAILAVTVRAPSPKERDTGTQFVVADAFGPMPLIELARRRADAAAGEGRRDADARGFPVAFHAGRHASWDDAATLAYLDALPRLERDREDLLGLRALLLMRAGRDGEAAPLVQQGIIRYPGTLLYFTLASELLERAERPSTTGRDALQDILRHRFSRRAVDASERSVKRFLGASARSR